MDESTKSIPPSELDSRAASDRTPVVADTLPAELTGSRQRDGPGRLFPSDHITPCPDDPCFGASVAVYCGSEEAVALGFRMA